MSEAYTPFVLTDGDRHASLWMRLKQHWTEELASSRARNDSARLSEAETAALRGRIGMLKALIALGDDRPMIPREQ